MTEQTVTARPTRVLNEAVLMFVRITQVLNKRDDLNDKVKHDSFYNDLDSAKAASRDLSNAQGIGYLWMTQAVDTLKDDGSVERVNHNYMWTKRNQWVKQPTKAYTISAEDVAKAAARNASGGTPASVQPANGPEDANADF
jgi:hypothetical protein